MIVSPRHKYVFVENPRTACTAIAKELRETYDGQEILFKHATYPQFVEWAGKENAPKYFAFAGIRNPMDEVLSEYFKIKTNHKGSMTDPSEHRRNGGWVYDYMIRQYEFITRTDADFSTYFLKYYKYPHVNRAVPIKDKMNFVIRFEHLQEDFSSVLAQLGLRQIRPLPVVNRTEKPSRDFLSFYTPEIRARAIKVFGPLMQYLGYQFPADWNAPKVSPVLWSQFFGLYAARRIHWRYVAFRNRPVIPRSYASIAVEENIAA